MSEAFETASSSPSFFSTGINDYFFSLAEFLRGKTNLNFSICFFKARLS
jgi:hypothetical protein